MLSERLSSAAFAGGKKKTSKKDGKIHMLAPAEANTAPPGRCLCLRMLLSVGRANSRSPLSAFSRGKAPRSCCHYHKIWIIPSDRSRCGTEHVFTWRQARGHACSPTLAPENVPNPQVVRTDPSGRAEDILYPPHWVTLNETNTKHRMCPHKRK